MGVMANSTTRVLCFGTQARDSAGCCDRMRAAGTEVVARVEPSGGPASCEAAPLYATAADAVRETGANAAFVDTLPDAAADAMMEAIDAGLSLIVCKTRAVPARDMVKVINYVHGSTDLAGPRHHEDKIHWLGPGSGGVITPGAGMVGTLNVDVFSPGRAAIVARCDVLAEAAAAALTREGIGQSSCLVTSAALIVPTHLVDVLGMLEADPDTEVIVIIGGVGGDAEFAAAAFIEEAVTKPVVAYLPGRSAPPGINLGAHGDFASAKPNEMEEKAAALQNAGALIVSGIEEIAPAVAERL